MKSAIEHKRAGKGCFFTVQFEKRVVIRYYGGTLMYVNPYNDKDSVKSFGKEVMSVSVRELRAYAVHIRYNVKHSEVRNHHARVIPALLKTLRLISELGYLEDDRTLQIVRDRNRSKTNVEFAQKLCPESSSELEQLYVICARILRNIEKREEQFVN